MAEQFVSHLVCLLLLSTVSFHLVSCQSQNQHYTEYGLENERICHPLNKKNKIKLTYDRNSAVIVKPLYLFSHWDGVLRDKECKFVVEANKGDGLFGVIQNISFRLNGTECLDYVEFKVGNYKSQKFCGKLHLRSMIESLASDLDEDTAEEFQRAAGSSSTKFRQIETKIFISKQPLSRGEELDLTIIYTPFKILGNPNPREYRLIDDSIYMSRDYYCDGYLNCDRNVCLDEIDCDVPEIVGNGTGTKVTVGAVTTIFLCFIIFVMCLWTCRKHKKMCWSPDCAGPRPQATSADESNRQPRELVSQPVPTAPMLEVAVPATVQNKDLPPSYDSLFPERANSAAT